MKMRTEKNFDNFQVWLKEYLRALKYVGKYDW